MTKSDMFIWYFYIHHPIIMHVQLISSNLYRTKSSGLILFILKQLSDETLPLSASDSSDEIFPPTPVKLRKRPQIVSHCESDTDTDLPVPRRAPHLYKMFYFM